MLVQAVSRRGVSVLRSECAAQKDGVVRDLGVASEKMLLVVACRW